MNCKTKRDFRFIVALILLINFAVSTFPGLGLNGHATTTTITDALTKPVDELVSVEGYVVGFPTKLNTYVTAPATNNVYICVADSQTETNISNMIIISIPSAYQSSFGLKAVPSGLGHKLSVTGTVTKFMGSTVPNGIKNVTEITWLDFIAPTPTPTPIPTPTPTPTPLPTPTPVQTPATSIISIANARAEAAGASVMVEGTVVFVDNKLVYIMDGDSAGIVVDFTKYIVTYTMQPFQEGDRIVARGIKGASSGLVTISPLTPEDITKTAFGQDYMQYVKTRTIAELKNYEGCLVYVENVVIGATDSATSFTAISDSANPTDTINIYKIPQCPYKQGDIVNIYAVVSNYKVVQLRVRKADDIFFGGVDTVSPVINMEQTLSAANILEDYTVKATITDDKRVKYAKLYYRVQGDVSYSSVYMTLQGTAYQSIIPKATLALPAMEIYIEANDGTNTSSSSVVTVMVDKTPVITAISPSEGYNTGTDLRPQISAKFDGDISISGVKLSLDGADITSKTEITTISAVYTPSQDLAKGNHDVKLEITDIKGKNITKEWNFSIGLNYNLYFGQLHAHTNVSDGAGTPDEAYTYARDSAKLDFFALTDHSNSFDMDTANENITSVAESTSSKWKLLHEKADLYNQDGKYVALAGYEMTWSGSTGGYGHINTFNTQWFASRSNKSMDLVSYYKKIAEYPESISMFNHPGKTFGDFEDFGHYTADADRSVQLIEVGNGEGPVRGSGYFPSYEYYTRALDKGWHVAPTNDQDNHKKLWGNSNTARVVALAPELDRNSIYDALKNKRCYATEDNNLRILYTVNGQIMGSFLNKPTSLDVNVDISDPDGEAIGKISIIANGGTVVLTDNITTSSVKKQYTLSSEYSYYYLRIDQTDKDIAVTAPVWTGESMSVGISKVIPSDVIAEYGKEVSVTVEVFNYQKDAFNNVRIELLEGGETGTLLGAYTIPTLQPSSVGYAIIKYIPQRTGKKTVYAKVTIIDSKGNTKVFGKSEGFMVLKAEDMTKAVLDCGHLNSYVAGGSYTGKYQSLKKLLTSKGVVLVENKGKFVPEIFDGAYFLIISDPDVSMKYDQSEIDAIKGFVNKGGNIIITSTADYKDGTGDYGNAAQGNNILKEVGSSLRFNDDELWDDTNNGGQAYRLRFTNYTGQKYDLTKDLFNTELFSIYSGCSIYVDPTADKSRTDMLVRVHDTTTSFDSDLQKDNNPLPASDLFALGADVLPNGSKIVAGGSTFFSDFEIDDTAATQFSNYVIVERIVDWMLPQVTYAKRKISDLKVDSNKDGLPDLMGQKVEITGCTTTQYKPADKNSFFDVVYLQDDTGGITIFGVSNSALFLGQKITIRGTVGQYIGDTQIQISDENKDIYSEQSNIPYIYQPLKLSTTDSMKASNGGMLTKVSGVVKRINSNNIYVDDGSGESRVFVDGYIGSSKGDTPTVGTWDSQINVGSVISAVGLASIDDLGARLRVRDTSEIVFIASSTNTTEITQKPEVSVNSVKTQSSGNVGSGGSGGMPVIPFKNSYFKDTVGHWAQEPIDELYKKGIIKGVSNDEFNPSGELTRAQFAVLLSRIAENGSIDEKKVKFYDVKNGDWYYSEVSSMAGMGVIIGDSNGNFKPNEVINREQMAVMIIRIYRLLTPDFVGSTQVDFKDSSEISQWANDAVATAQSKGFIKGIDGEFMPKKTATRAESAQILSILMQKLNK